MRSVLTEYRVKEYVKYLLKYAVSNVFLSKNKRRQKYVQIRFPIFFGNSFENLIHGAFVRIFSNTEYGSISFILHLNGIRIYFWNCKQKNIHSLIKPLTSIIRNSTYYFIRPLDATKSLVTYFIQRQ